MWSVTASRLAVAMCSLFAVSCSGKGGGLSGTNGRGAGSTAGSSVTAANGSSGGDTGGVPQGTGSSTGGRTGGALGGTGGSPDRGTGGAAESTGGSLGNGTGGAAQGIGGGIGNGTGGVDLGTAGSIGVGTGGMIADAGPDAIACSRGATLADCQLCQGDVPAICERACPKVDCSVYPPPAECEPICAGGTCCECQPSLGNEYSWRTPQVSIQCGTSCTDVVSKWNALVSQPSLTACTVDSDCAAVGGTGSCSCVRSLSGCGKAVNLAAYQATDGPAIESAFQQGCENTLATCDCGPAYVGCRAGQCVVTGYGC